MPQFLLELRSEEIPARMQIKAAEELLKRLHWKLDVANLTPETLDTFVTPRRLVAHAEGVDCKQKDQKYVEKGPRIGSPDKAITGF